MNLLILGASARAAAFSSLRAGLRPLCVDLFADRDLTAVAPARRVAAGRYPRDLAALADEAPPSPWVYTGALENHPGLIERIAAARPLWGNGGATLRAVRDPAAVAEVLRRAGLPAPRVRRGAEGLPRDGSWLVKPLASAGGQGVRPLTDRTGPPRRPSYYQERVAGLSLSATFIGRRPGASLAGVTRQWLGRPGAPFAYLGSLGPWPLPPDERARVEAVGGVLASAFDLVGLFGVDFVLRDGRPWPVEVNPRYTASVEVLELALGRALLAEHRRACDPHAPGPEGLPPAPGPHDRPAVVGKLILFAPRRCVFPEDEGWPSPPEEHVFSIPRCADVPHPGTVFEAGEPVLTLVTGAASPEECRRRLTLLRAGWERRIGV